MFRNIVMLIKVLYNKGAESVIAEKGIAASKDKAGSGMDKFDHYEVSVWRCASCAKYAFRIVLA
jgi:hypothetical protein